MDNVDSRLFERIHEFLPPSPSSFPLHPTDKIPIFIPISVFTKLSLHGKLLRTKNENKRINELEKKHIMFFVAWLAVTHSTLLDQSRKPGITMYLFDYGNFRLWRRCLQMLDKYFKVFVRFKTTISIQQALNSQQRPMIFFPCFQRWTSYSKKYRRCYSKKIINIGYLFYICRNQSDHFVRYIKKPRTTTMAKESQFVVFFFS